MPHDPLHPDPSSSTPDQPETADVPDFASLLGPAPQAAPAQVAPAQAAPAPDDPADPAQSQAPAEPQPGFETEGAAGGPDFTAIFDDLEATAEQDRTSKKRLLDWRIANPSMDPDTAGEVIRLTASLNASGANIDPSFVAENLEKIKFRAAETPFDTEVLAREHPELSAFLSTTEGAAGVDDVDNLQRLSQSAKDLDLVSSESLVDDLHRRVSGILRIDTEWLRAEETEGIDWLLRAPRDVLGDKAREQEMIYSGFRAMRGWGTPAEEEYSKALFRRLQRTYGADGWLEKAWAGLFDWGSEIAIDLGVRAAGGVAGAKIGGGIGALGGTTVAPGPGTVAGGGGGAGVGAVVGQFTSDFAWSYYQTAGSLYTSVLVEAEAKGLEVDREKVAESVEKGSVAIAAMFSLSFGKVLNRVPGVREVYATVMRRAVKQALTAGTRTRAGGRAVTQLATNYALVGGVMGTQAAGQRVTTELALEAGSPQHKADFGQVPDAFVAGAVDAMIGFGFLGALGPTVDLRSDFRRLSVVQSRAESLESAVAAVKESKLAERAPEKVEELYRSFQGEKPKLDEVFFSVEDFDAHWKGLNLDPKAAAAELLGDGGKAYDEAKAAKNDIAVPVETYLTRIVRGEQASPLAELARLEDGGRSVVEEQAWHSEMPDRIRELVAVDVDKMEEGRRQLYEKWKAQAIGAGVRKEVADANARLVSAIFDQFATRLNEDAARRGEPVDRTAVELHDELADVAILGPGQERVVATAEAEADQAALEQASAAEVALEQPAAAEGTLEQPAAAEVALEQLAIAEGTIEQQAAAEAAPEQPAAVVSTLEKALPREAALEAPTAAEAALEQPAAAEGTPEQQAAAEAALEALTAAEAALEPAAVEAGTEPIEQLEFVFPDLGVGVLRFEQPAFHGTPHRFDKFTLDHIGTGEGAQAFGWGLYFAESKDVAEFYRSKLASPGTGRAATDAVRVRGVPLADLPPDERGAAHRFIGVPQADVAALAERSITKLRGLADLASSGKDYAAALRREAAAIERIAPNLTTELVGEVKTVELPESTELLDYDRPLSEQPPEVQKSLVESGIIDLSPEELVSATEAEKRFAEAEREVTDIGSPEGAARWVMLKSGPKEAPERLREFAAHALKTGEERDARNLTAAAELIEGMSERELDFWAGKHQQHTDDKATFGGAILLPNGERVPPSKATGRVIYSSLEERYHSDKAASLALLEAGIPGLQFLDQGSRGVREGTHNFVVWDENAIQAQTRLEQPAFHGTASEQVLQVDLSKVGTGTGLAAEGWGFYATDLEHIAELYQEAAVERAGPEATGQVLRLDIPEDSDLLDSRASVAGQNSKHVEALRSAGLVETRDGELWVTAGVLEQPAAETTAKELYRAIGDQWLMGVGKLQGVVADRPDEAASRFLGSIGILGMHYPAELRPGGVAGRNFVVWDEAGIDILDVLHQEEQKDAAPRGFIEFTSKQGAEPRKFNIRILEDGDESTLAHETAHFLIEVMGDIVSLEDAPAVVAADYGTLLGWMGYESPAERQAALAERRGLMGRRDLSGVEALRLREIEAKEERLSRGWEGYLADGKAPSPELAGVFAHFRGWMLRLYRGLIGIERQYKAQFGEELAINDTVRGVFDRLLSSSVDTEIARRAADQGIFAPAYDLMTPEQQETYSRLDQESRDDAEVELLRRITDSQRRENKAWLRDERRRIQEEIEASLDEDTTYRAISALQSGKVPGREGLTKLDRRAVERVIGVEGRQALPRGVTAPRGGAKPDDVAALLGFDDGDALVAAMLEAEPRKKLVERATREELEATYGKELLEDPGALAQAALASVHTDKAALKILHEMRAMVGDLGGEARRSSVADLGVMQDNVRRLLSDKQLRQISPGRYLRSERAAGARALQAALDGDLHRSYAEKEAQLLNMLLYRGAKEIRDGATKAERRLKRMRKESRRSRLGRASPIYRDSVDGILAAVGMAPEPANPVTVEALLSQLERDAIGVERVEDPVTGVSRLEAQFDADLLESVLRTPKKWSHLTPHEAQTVSDAVAVVDTAAKYSTEVEIEGKRIARAEWLEEAAATAAMNIPKAQPLELSRTASEASIIQRAGQFLQNADGLLLEMETMVTMLDGGDLDGTFRKAIIDPYREARFREGELAGQYLERLLAQWEKMPAELAQRAGESVDLTSALPVPEALSARANRHVRPRSDLWVIALNLGNEGNKQRLLDGYGWTESQVMSVLDEHLTQEEWGWVQSVWDSLESLYPEVARVHEEDTGLPLGKVAATEVETKHGTFRGGYFPAVYDSRLSGLGTKQEETPATVAGLLGGSFTRPATAKSHTKGRAAQVKDYLLLDWSVIPSHVSQVVHDIAYRPYLKQTASLFLDKRFQSILAERLGEQRAKQWIPWLQAVAAGTSSGVPVNQKEVYRTIRGMRNRSAIAIIGWSLPVAMGDFTNPLMAAAGGLVSLRQLTPALARAANPFGFRKMREFVLEHSAEVAHRARQDETSLVHQLDVISGKDVQLNPARRFIRGVQESAFALMRWTDALTTTPTWWASYQQSMAERRVAITEGKLDHADAHAEAVKRADFVIGRLFPSHEAGERSAVLNDRGFLGSLLMFHSYMNKIYNLQRLTAHEGITTWQDPGSTSLQKLGAFSRATGLLLAQWVVFGAAGELLSGRGAEEGEEHWEWLLRKIFSAPFSTIPFIGQGAEQVIGSTLTGVRPRPSVRAAPGLAVIDSVIRNWDRMRREDEPDKALFDLFEIVGVVTGLPTNQVRRTGRFLAGGEADPSKPADFASGIIYGKRPRQPQNIFTLED